MRVLITSNFAPPHVGGVENSIRHLALEGFRKGDDVLVISSDWPCAKPSAGAPLPDCTLHLKYRAFVGAPQPLRSVLSLCSAYLLFKRVCRTFAPDIVIVRYHANVLAARLAGLKHVYYVVPGVLKYQNDSNNMSSSGSVAGWVAYQFNNILQRWAFSAAHKLYVFSHSMLAQVSNINSERSATLVSPGVDGDRFYPRDPALPVTDSGARSAEISLLCVGRLVRAKGFHIAVAALRDLPERYTLTLVGDGEERDYLERIAKDLSIENRVRFVGAVDCPESHYRQCHLFLMTSTYEPFGQTILEASACGVPTVAFRPGPSIDTSTDAILGSLATYAEQPTPKGLSAAVARAYERFYVTEPESKYDLVRRVAERNGSWQKLYSELTRGA